MIERLLDCVSRDEVVRKLKEMNSAKALSHSDVPLDLITTSRDI